MAVVQSFAAEPRTLDEFDLRNEGKLSVELRSVFWQSMLSAVIQLASMLSVAGLLVAAGGIQQQGLVGAPPFSFPAGENVVQEIQALAPRERGLLVAPGDGGDDGRGRPSGGVVA